MYNFAASVFKLLDPLETPAFRLTLGSYLSAQD